MINTKPPISGRPLSSGEWIRTTDLRLMSNAPESVLFVRPVLQISKPDERWFLPAWHAAVPQGDDIANRYSYGSYFIWVRQVYTPLFGQ